MQKQYPKISIVTVCYNHESFIAETIESVLSQNYPNLEYIVIDDGSKDQSWEIIRRYADRLSFSERMEGYRTTPVIALNAGFKKTTGDIMMWLNSDDILLPKSLFVIAKIYQEHPTVEWLTGMATTINQRTEIVNSKLRLKHKQDFLIGDWKIIQQESTSWRRSLWEKTGGYLSDEIKWAFDTELWTRFFTKSEHYHAATPIGAFRSGQQSKSISDPNSFLKPSTFFINRFIQTASKKEKCTSFIYRFCRLFRHILALIPDQIMAQLPFLSKYCYRVFEYSVSDDAWRLKQLNPFRKKYHI